PSGEGGEQLGVEIAPSQCLLPNLESGEFLFELCDRRVLNDLHRLGLDSRHWRSEEHTSELQSLTNLVCRLLLEKKQTTRTSRAARSAAVASPHPGGLALSNSLAWQFFARLPNDKLHICPTSRSALSYLHRYENG